MVWFGAKARKELMKALNEAENKLGTSEKVPVLNAVVYSMV